MSGRIADLVLFLPLLQIGCSEPTTIEVGPQPILIKRSGEVRRLDVRILDGRGRPLTDRGVAFTSLTPEIVSVDAQGVVVARRSGDGEVLVTSGNVSATAKISVRIAAKIEISPLNPILNLGVSRDLHATIFDDSGELMASAGPIRWSVSDPAVVSVSKSGMIKTLKEGRATVTAFAGDIRANTVITVRHEKYEDKGGTWSR